jgi:cell division protein ZapA
MPQLSVSVNGRAYTLACEDGQEERLRGLVGYIDGKVQEFAKREGQVGESRLILLAALTIADELADATDALRRQRRAAPPTANGATEIVLANGIDQLASRIEAIAERLEKVQL